MTANADHVNQANAAKKPTLQSGAGDLLNGHPVIRGDGIDDYLQGAFTNGGNMNQPNTIFVVGALDAALVGDPNPHHFMDGNNAAFEHKINQQNAAAFMIWSGTFVFGPGVDANWNIWTVLFNSPASQFWHNGIAKCAPGNTGAENCSGITMLASTGGVQNLLGDVAEYILYDANLSNADKNQVGAYLAARYALSYTDI